MLLLLLLDYKHFTHVFKSDSVECSKHNRQPCQDCSRVALCLTRFLELIITSVSKQIRVLCEQEATRGQVVEEMQKQTS